MEENQIKCLIATIQFVLIKNVYSTDSLHVWKKPFISGPHQLAYILDQSYVYQMIVSRTSGIVIIN